MQSRPKWASETMSNQSATAPNRLALTAIAGLFALVLAGCAGDGTASPGIGTVGGAAAGAGASRALFGSSTSGMLLGAAAGGLAGNMTLDRQAEQRRQSDAQATADANMRRQLEFERQRTLQQEETRRQIEEQRQFDEWRRQQGR
ncbi:MAG: hypothetical protein WAS73_16350 [Defluviicoccus sp.]